jgi:hypothetical protein
MQKKSLIKTMAFSIIIGLMASTACIQAAEAGERNRGGSFVTGKGKSGSYSGNRSGSYKDGGTVNRSQSVTGPNGNTKTRNTSGTYNKDTGAFNKTVTGANGKTRTYEGTAADGQRSGTYTTESGKSGTFDATVQKNEDGTFTRQGSWTNQDGETKNRSATYGYDKETGTATKTFTNNQGVTKNRNVTVTPNAGNE